MPIHPRYLGGRWFPDGGVIHPLRLVRGLAAAARCRGATLATRTAVLRVAPELPGPGHDVHTSRGHIQAEHVVWACGAAFRYFRPEFEPATSLARGQVLSTTPLPPLFRTGMAVDWGTVYWRQAADGAILLGGCRHLDLDGETGPGQRVNPRIQQALTGFLPEAFPGFPPFRVARRWAGVMDYTADGRPLIGPVPEAPGQWVIAGFGGHGLPPAVGAGRALASAIVTGRMPADLEPYDPARLLKESLPC
jgi:sarcosine oxidase subunit beta